MFSAYWSMPLLTGTIITVLLIAYCFKSSYIFGGSGATCGGGGGGGVGINNVPASWMPERLSLCARPLACGVHVVLAIGRTASTPCSRAQSLGSDLAETWPRRSIARHAQRARHARPMARATLGAPVSRSLDRAESSPRPAVDMIDGAVHRSRLRKGCVLSPLHTAVGREALCTPAPKRDVGRRRVYRAKHARPPAVTRAVCTHVHAHTTPTTVNLVDVRNYREFPATRFLSSGWLVAGPREEDHT